MNKFRHSKLNSKSPTANIYANQFLIKYKVVSFKTVKTVTKLLLTFTVLVPCIYDFA